MIVKRIAKTLTALGLVSFFSLGIWCTSLAAPDSSASGMPGCSQNNPGTVVPGCEHPSFLCAPTPFYTSFSKSAFTYLQIGGFSKLAPLAIDGFVTASSSVGISPAKGSPASLSRPTQEVPIYLFNSVLTL